MSNIFFILAALLALIGVGAGAFGTHALADFLAEVGRADTYETAVRYQMYHALALFGVAVTQKIWPQAGWLTWSGWLFVIGTVIFSGSLYLLIFSGQRWLGAITPIGGVAFIGGWLMLLLAAWQSG
ncbi:MAG: DUF423 domain-containing protein [Ardenticatenaceae bacterium]|nr:DUF423 domain-containing protein [Ardenticatenaceae bacterium]